MEKNQKEPWFSDEWFWETYGPLMFDEIRLSDTPAEAEGIIRLTGLDAKAEILDCCCGMGRHSIELASRGYRLTGTDLSEGYLKIARQEAEKRQLAVDWRRMDVRDLDYQDRFDGIINMFTSFGYFEDPEEDLILLKKLHAALKQGGVLFMEMMGKEVLARDFEERVWFEREGIKILLEYSVDLNWTELHNRWLFFQENKMTEYSFRHRIFAASEMAAMLWQAGFETIDIYGDFKGNLYDHKAKQLILVAHK
jgi:SAM-dependent methyltransferase